MFYRTTILFSQMLGTAPGDWMADTTGLGYEGGALVSAHFVDRKVASAGRSARRDRSLAAVRAHSWGMAC